MPYTVKFPAFICPFLKLTNKCVGNLEVFNLCAVYNVQRIGNGVYSVWTTFLRLKLSNTLNCPL